LVLSLFECSNTFWLVALIFCLEFHPVYQYEIFCLNYWAFHFQISIWFFQDFYNFIEFISHVLHCHPYFVQLFIWILFELIHLLICILFKIIQVFIHVLFNFIDDFIIILLSLLIKIPSTSILFKPFIDCRIVEFLRRHIALIFILLVYLHLDLCI
jgi:hypothetical protein